MWAWFAASRPIGPVVRHGTIQAGGGVGTGHLEGVAACLERRPVTSVRHAMGGDGRTCLTGQRRLGATVGLGEVVREGLLGFASAIDLLSVHDEAPAIEADTPNPPQSPS